MLHTDLTGAAEHLKFKAVVIRLGGVVKNGCFLKLYSPQLGIIDCFFRRHRQQQQIPLYAYAEFEVFYYKNKYSLNEYSLIYSFQQLFKAVECLQAACLCSDLLADLVVDKEQADKLWALYLRFLYELDSLAATFASTTVALKDKFHYVVAAFILRALADSGYGPDTAAFVSTMEQEELSSSTAFTFSFTEGRLKNGIYKSMPLEESSNVGYRQAEALRYIMQVAVAKLFQVTVSAALAQKLYDFAKQWLLYSLDHVYNSQRALEQMEGATSSLEDLAKQIGKRQDKANFKQADLSNAGTEADAESEF